MKAGSLPAAIRAAKPWIGPHTIIVGLQNGLGHEKILRRAFGAARVVIGSCYVGADRLKPDHIALSGRARIALALTASNKAALNQAKNLLEESLWEIRVEKSESRMLWTKLIFNAAGNSLGAVCNAPTGRLDTEPLRTLLLQTLREAIAIAKAAGHRPLHSDKKMIEGMLWFCRNAPLQRNSMLQDLQAGRPTEAKAILGPFLAAARRTRTPAPTLTMLARLISQLER